MASGFFEPNLFASRNRICSECDPALDSVRIQQMSDALRGRHLFQAGRYGGFLTFLTAERRAPVVRMMSRAMSSTGWMARIAVVALALGSPAIAEAQTSAGLAGAVKAATGAVLPGPTAEAASPALLERVRT